MKKVNQKFLEEQVKLMLNEIGDSNAANAENPDNKENKYIGSCKSSKKYAELDIKEFVQMLLVGSSDSIKAVGGDIADRITWGKSKSALMQKAAYVQGLNRTDSRLFRLLEPVFPEKGKVGVKMNDKYFEEIKRSIKKYSKKLYSYRTEDKSNIFSEDIIRLIKSYVKDILKINKKHGLTDDKPSLFIQLLSQVVDLDHSSMQVGRYTPPTAGWIDNKAQKFIKILKSDVSERDLFKKLETMAVQISNFGLEFSDFNEVRDHINSPESDLLKLANTVGYRKALENTPIFWAYFDIFVSTITSIYGFGIWSSAAKVSKTGRTLKVADSLVGLGAPLMKDGLLKIIAQTNMAVANRITNETAKFLTSGLRNFFFGASEIVVKLASFSIPLMVSVRVSMEPVIEQLPILTIRYGKLIDQYFNVIENNKIDDSLLPGNETVDVLDMAFQSLTSNGKDKKNLQSVDNSRELSSEEAKVLKKQLQKEIEDTVERMTEAIFTDFGDIFSLCEGLGAFISDRDEIKEILLENLRSETPNKELHVEFIEQASLYLKSLQEMDGLYKKIIAENQQASEAAKQEIKNIEQSIRDTKVSLPSGFGQIESTDKSGLKESPSAAAPGLNLGNLGPWSPSNVLKTSNSQAVVQSASNDLKTKIQNLTKAEDQRAFALNYSDIFSSSIGLTLRNSNNAYQAKRLINNSNLRGFTENKIKYLKSLHKLNLRTWAKEYQEDIKKANGDPILIQNAEKKMAFYHRPMYYVTLTASRLEKFFGTTQLQFGFEPNVGRVNVAEHASSSLTFYKQHGQNNKAFNDFLRKLELLKIALEEADKGIDKLESQFSGNVTFYEKFKDVLANMIEVTEKAYSVLKDDSEPAVRRAYQIYVLDIMLAAF